MGLIVPKSNADALLICNSVSENPIRSDLIIVEDSNYHHGSILSKFKN